MLARRSDDTNVYERLAYHAYGVARASDDPVARASDDPTTTLMNQRLTRPTDESTASKWLRLEFLPLAPP